MGLNLIQAVDSKQALAGCYFEAASLVVPELGTLKQDPPLRTPHSTPSYLSPHPSNPHPLTSLSSRFSNPLNELRQWCPPLRKTKRACSLKGLGAEKKFFWDATVNIRILLPLTCAFSLSSIKQSSTVEFSN